MDSRFRGNDGKEFSGMTEKSAREMAEESSRARRRRAHGRDGREFTGITDESSLSGKYRTVRNHVERNQVEQELNRTHMAKSPSVCLQGGNYGREE